MGQIGEVVSSKIVVKTEGFTTKGFSLQNKPVCVTLLYHRIAAHGYPFSHFAEENALPDLIILI